MDVIIRVSFVNVLITCAFLSACGGSGGGNPGTELPPDPTTDPLPTQNGPAPIVMFSPNNSFSGNLGGRTGADNSCIAAASTVAACDGKSNIHAFIGINTNDEVRDIPLNYGYDTSVSIIGPTEVIISNNWQGLLVGNNESSLSNSLSAAQVLPSGTKWWSGSDSFGGVGGGADFLTCIGWTTNTSSNTYMGIAGDSVNDDRRWIRTGTYTNNGQTLNVEIIRCNLVHRLVCLCGE